MRILVTGASGHIGSAVVPELINAGHDVVGLARSDHSAAIVEAMGATVHRGDLTDLDALAATARETDGVVHLAFDHAQMRAGDMAGAAAADHALVQAFEAALAGSGKLFIGIGHGPSGNPALDEQLARNPRFAVAKTIIAIADQGVRAMLMGVPPVTHSDRDQHGFLSMMIDIARRSGVSGYPTDGENTWPAAHTLDVGHLFALAVDGAPAGTQLVAAAEPGVRVRDIAEMIGRHLDLPAESIPADRLLEHFGPFGQFVGMNLNMPSDTTRELLGWTPTHPGLLADLDAGHYFTK